jgi:hypothetical protein
VYLILQCYLADFPPKRGIPTGLQVAKNKEKIAMISSQIACNFCYTFLITLPLCLHWYSFFGLGTQQTLLNMKSGQAVCLHTRTRSSALTDYLINNIY